MVGVQVDRAKHMGPRIQGTMMKDQAQIQAQLMEDAIANHHVGEIFVAAADKGFRSLDVFVTWFAAGTAAALGLAAANLDRLTGLVSLTAIKSAMPWLGGAMLLILVSKFLGSLVCTMAGAADEARRIRREAVNANERIPSGASFVAAVERATPWPVRWLTRRRVPLGRRVMRILMGSGFAALVSCVFVVIFWGVMLAPAWKDGDSPLRNRTESAKITDKNEPVAAPIAERK